MDGQAIIAVSAAVVALTQLVKGLGLSSRFSPLVVLLLSAIGVFIWGYSANDTFQKDQLFSYFAGWIVIATAAKGAYEGAKDVLKKQEEEQK